MKYSTVIVAFAGFTAAQSLNDVPECARPCLIAAIANTTCAPTDTACLCKPENYQAILPAATPCVVAQCGPQAAVDQVLPAAGRICPAGGSAASSAVQVASSAVSAAASSSAVAATTIATAATSAAVSSVAGTVATPVTSAPRAGITRTATITSVVTALNGTVTATTTQLPVTVNGAAAQGPIGIAAALALGALAYL
ncbi:hypothetical protein LZ32DRAFT_644839 [Colletotrichum eremochloae]|nr:hypothetical protein LZ32DRAFT_644839 [Colletotrichum eremochloae]